jgi:hypothetical protein
LCKHNDLQNEFVVSLNGLLHFPSTRDDGLAFDGKKAPPLVDMPPNPPASSRLADAVGKSSLPQQTFACFW